MKKNTAFIRRLRTSIGAAGLSAILLEIRTLSLHKYLSEIISACYEGLTKVRLPADIAAAVEVFSALHQRFGPSEFTCFLGWLIGRGLATPDKAQLRTLAQDAREREEKDRHARQKILLRLSTELWLVGALRSLDDVQPPEDAAKNKENVKPLLQAPPKGAAAAAAAATAAKSADATAEPFPLEALKELLAQDAQHVQLAMIAQYTRVFSWDLLGKADPEADHSDDQPLADDAMRERFKNVLGRYFDGAKQHLLRDQGTLSNQSRRNAEAYVRSGEIFEDRQANYEKMVKSQEKFVSSLQTLADCLGQEMPEHKDSEADSKANDSNIGLVKTGEYLRGDADNTGIWEDDDERRFYENLIDLKDRVPPILLEDPKRKKLDGDEQVGKRNDDAKPADDKSAVNGDVAEAVNGDQSAAIANRTVGAQVDALLARLPHVTSKEGIDEIAVDFCFVNSKASRNRLLRAVQDVPKARSDLLPLYSRLVATLGKYMQDLTQGLVTNLEEEFKSLQRRKQKDSLGGVRTSNIRYLAELTKFGVVPEHKIFHCFKVSLDDFSKMNIEIICNLLENCGRYLLRTPETAPRMKSFLETLLRKKSAQHLGQQERMLIENAAYTVDPPERAAIQQKERTPLDLFVRKLLYVDLNKRNVERVIKQIRKLHWEEHDVVQMLHKVFVKPGRIKYSSIHFLAIILGSLNRYHQDFCVSVIDDLLESIHLGLELNDFKYNQRRLAEVRYLGELYVYRMIDSSIIFDTMYRILTYGHGGWPRPGMSPVLDQSDDFFRIRLVCSLLETCGTYYEKGAAKRKLDFFLTFFQYYIQTKDPIPMDIDFLIDDAFALVRPSWKITKTLEESGAAFAEACRENYKNTGSEKPNDVADDEVEMMVGDDDGDAEGRQSPNVPDDGSSTTDGEQHEGDDVQADSEDASTEEEEEDEQIVVTRPEDERDPEVDAEFDRELASIMAESVNENRKTDRKPMFDVALPMRRQANPKDAAAEDNKDIAAVAPAPFNPETVQFSLLSKRGNKPQTRSIELPADSSFAVAHRSQREAEKAEQQRIKALVLNYESSDVAPPAHEGGLERPINQPSISGRQGDPGSRASGRRQQVQARKLQLSDVDW